MGRFSDIRRVELKRLAIVLAMVLMVFQIMAQAICAEEPRYGGSLTFGVEAEFAGFDVLKARGVAICDAIANITIQERLFDMDKDGRLIPVLGLSATPSADGKSWTIKLRDGVFFHDGTPFDADAAVHHFNRLLNPQNRYAGRAFIQPIQAVEKLDNLTIRFKLAHAWRPFLSHLCNARGLGATIPSPKAVEEGTQMRAPVGTGPFMFKEWTAGDRLMVVKNPNYWQKGKPYLDAIVFKPIPDDLTRFASLKSGQTDAIWTDRGNLIDQAESDPSLAHFQGEGKGAEIFILNTTRPPLNDVRIRRAIAHAWNQKVCVRMSYGNSIPSVHHPFGADKFFGDAGYRSYDPEKAKTLLAEAQVDGPIVLDCLHSNTKRGSEQGELLQQFCKKIGVTIRPVGLAFGPVVRKVFSKDYQVSTWRMPSVPDQGPYLFAAFHSKSPHNVTGYNNPRMDELLMAQRRETDPEKRKTILAEIAKLINDDVPIIYRGGKLFHVLARTSVMGIGEIQNGIVMLSQAWIEK